MKNLPALNRSTTDTTGSGSSYNNTSSFSEDNKKKRQRIAAPHPTDGTGISIDAIRAMIDGNSNGNGVETGGYALTSERPAFAYRSIKHRRKSEGLFQYATGIDNRSIEISDKFKYKKSMNSIDKTTKARILNTIADAIHQRRSLFGA